ncbi:MAG: hypothetical protein V1809_07035 [Planctomycetota bacterium]
MNQILAIARLTLHTGLSRKMSYVLLGINLLCLYGACVSPNLDSPEARISRLAAVTTGWTVFFTAATAIFVAATFLPDSIRDRRIYTILPKPVRRHELILGIWVGVLALSFGFMAMTGVSGWLAMRLAVPAADLTVSRILIPVRRMVDDRILTNPGDEAVLAGGAKRILLFYEEIPSSRFPSGKAIVRMKLGIIPQAGDRSVGRCPMRLTLSNPVTGWSQERRIDRVEDGRAAYAGFDLPILPSGGKHWFTLTTEMDSGGYIIIAGQDDISLISPTGTMALNLVKALGLAFTKMAVLSAITVMGSTFLSAPVAVLFAFFVFLCGYLVQFLQEVAKGLALSPAAAFQAFLAKIGRVGSNTPRDEVDALFENARKFGVPAEVVEEVRRNGVTPEIRALAERLTPPWDQVIWKKVIQGFCRMVPDFGNSAYSGMARVSDRVDIPWAHVGEAAWVYGCYAAAALVLGILFFWYAEVE